MLISNAISVTILDVPATVERDALVGEVARTGTAGEALRRLIEMYPEAALRAICAGRWVGRCVA